MVIYLMGKIIFLAVVVAGLSVSFLAFADDEVQVKSEPLLTIVGEEISPDGFDFSHVNDTDMIGARFLGGAFDSEDDGRTMGFRLSWYTPRENHSFSLNLQSWVFSRRTGENGSEVLTADGGKVRETLEKYVLVAEFRRYLDEDGKSYLIIGVHAVGDHFGQGVLSEIQNAFHSIIDSRQVIGLETDDDHVELYGNLLIGAGAGLDLINVKHFSMHGVGELVLAPSPTHWERESFIALRGAIRMGIGRRKNSPHPHVSIQIFDEERFHRHFREYVRGLEISRSFGKKTIFKPYLNYAVYDTLEDQFYNGGTNPTTTIGVNIRFGKRHKGKKNKGFRSIAR